jgi:hypothetical protein
VIGHFACERREADLKHLRISGIERGDRWEVVDHCMLADGDVLVVVKCPGARVWAQVGSTRYEPTSFELLRLKPIDLRKGGSFSRHGPTLAELPREERDTFVGWYRIEETLAEIEPGRKKGPIKDAHAGAGHARAGGGGGDLARLQLEPRSRT